MNTDVHRSNGFRFLMRPIGQCIGNGNFVFDFVPTVVDIYSVNVTMSGMLIRGSPFPMDVTSSNVH